MHLEYKYKLAQNQYTLADKNFLKVMVLELETVHHNSVSSKRRGVFNLFGLFLGQNRQTVQVAEQ